LTTLLVLILPLGGCSIASLPVDSQIVGDWRGTVLTQSTHDKPARLDDYRVTILPGGRFEAIGNIDGQSVRQTGQVIHKDGKPAARVLLADYSKTSSRVAVEFLGMGDAGRPVSAGETLYARLLPDGRLEFFSFLYITSPTSPADSRATAQHGVLYREQATSRPE